MIRQQGQKKLIEQADEHVEAAGLELWNEDEAGPYQAIPHPGEDWHPAGKPHRLPHEYQRRGTAKLLTLFRPATGTLRAKGVQSAPNVVLHPWLKEQFLQELEAIERQHPAQALPPEAERPLFAQWETRDYLDFTHFYGRAFPTGDIPFQQTAWYRKRQATFADVLATARSHLWNDFRYSTSRQNPDSILLPRSDLSPR